MPISSAITYAASTINEKNKLAKLTIRTWRTKVNDVQNNEARSGKIEVMFNPESVTIEYRNTWQKPQGLGTSGAKLSFAANKPEKIKMKLIFADSNLNEHTDFNLNGYGPKAANLNSDTNGISGAIERFLVVTTEKLADTHRPYYLSLHWGNVFVRPQGSHNVQGVYQRETEKAYPCQLESVDVKYTLFSRDGAPLRAELTCVFVEDYHSDAKPQLYSPDVTHAKSINAGDQLSRMTAEVYENSSWYPKVAKVNKLDSVRKIEKSRVLNFPPLQE